MPISTNLFTTERMRGVTDYLLSTLDIHPVLFDIGASGPGLEVWEKIARHSIYVGFDPDSRELCQVPESHFYKAMLVNEAVTSDKERNEVLFYLTHSPYCSSTLKPDSASLAHFLFSELFVVEREVEVRATSLDSVLDRLSLSRVDWLKADTQGTDLRLFNSLRNDVRARVLAIDVEPGLIDAYVGEDLFVDVHKDLTRNGFWLSTLNVVGTARMRRTTLQEVTKARKGINSTLVERSLKKSPAYCEARYLRTAEWLNQHNLAQADYVLLWIFALLDSQFGFALDLAIEYERVFGKDDIAQRMKDEAVRRLTRKSRYEMLSATAKSVVPRQVKQWIKKHIP